MANDNRRGHKVKDTESIKSKKKMVTQDASPESSSSRRSSRETSSRKQTKENLTSTRKSERLEKLKPSGITPIKETSERTQEQTNTTPLKRYNRRNKHTSLDSSGSKKSVEEPASSNTKSKKGKVKRSLKQCMVDAKEDKTHKRQGKKRKRVATSVDKALSKRQQIRTEAGNDSDTGSQDESSQANSSSNRDVDTDTEKPENLCQLDDEKNETSGSKSAEDKDGDVEECCDGTGEESTHKGSETQCSTSNSSLTNFEVEEINDAEGDKASPNSKRLEEVPHVKEPLDEKTHHGESIENGSETPNGKGTSSKRETPSRKTDPESSTDIKEFWVPVQISNVQLEQYCSMLLSNSMALSSCSKSDTFGALHDILASNRKCCDHPYIVDQSLQATLTKDLEPAKFLDVGIKASGKLQFLDLILPEMKKRQLRVLILFQPLSGSGKDSTSIGDILDDFVRQRFGEDSYERVDAIGTINSKRQATLYNFNNKDMGRFIFLLDYRACHSSIKLSSIDSIVIFDSDWNPANDLRALQKIAIDSKLEQIKIFRLYTSWTLEEKILKLADHNVTIDKGLQNLSRSISDALLMWGATYLFKKLDEFHAASVMDISSEECFNEVKEEFLNLISEKDFTPKLIITRTQQSGGSYCQNLGLTNELPDGEQPHTFWRKLLAGKNPCWKYLSRSTPRHRKRPQYFESVTPKKTNVSIDDGGRKRKKTANNIIEPVASNPVIEKVPSSDSIWSAANCNEKSFRILLKLNISELCQVLKLSDDVKTMTERFLEYVIENFRVNKEPANTLQAFLISLCWIGCDLLNKKLDKKQSLALAKKHLKFSCEEEETDSVFLKLETAKDMFLLQKKTKPVKVEIPDSPEDYVIISPDTSDAPEDQKDSHGSNTSNSAESEQKPPSVQDNLQTKEVEKDDLVNSEDPMVANPVVVESRSNFDVVPPAEEPVVENTPNVQTNVSPEIPPDNPFQNSVMVANPVVVESQSNFDMPPAEELVVENTPNVQTNVSPEIPPDNPFQNSVMVANPVVVESQSNFDIPPAEELVVENTPNVQTNVSPEIPPDNPFQNSVMVANPVVVESQSNFDMPPAEEPVVENTPNVQTNVSPEIPPDYPFQNSVLLDMTPDLPNHAAMPPGPNLLGLQRSENHNRVTSNPLLSEMEKLCDLKNTVVKYYEAIKQKLKSDFEREVAEMIAKMNRKYEAKCQHAEAAFQLKSNEIDINLNRVLMNKILAEAFRVKCHYLSSTDPLRIQVSQSGGIQHMHSGMTSSSGSQQHLQPPLEIVHQSARLFSATPTMSTWPPPSNISTTTTPPIRPPPNITSSTRPPPPSNTIPTTTPTRPPPPPSNINPTTTPTRPPSNINPSARPPPPSNNSAATTPPTRPPPNITPSTRPPPPPPSNIIPTTTPTRPPPPPPPPPSNINPTTTPTRPPPNITPSTRPPPPPPPPPPPSNIIPTTTPTRPPPSNINPITKPPPNISNITPSTRPPPTINPLSTPTRPPPNINSTTISARGEIRAPAPHIRPFKPSTSMSPLDIHRAMLGHHGSSPPFSHTPAKPPLPPPSFPTNQNSHPTQNSSQPEPPLPSFHSFYPSEQQPPPAMSSSLPPLPSISVSHTGLYRPDILSQPALDLLMDIDKQASLHQTNMLSSQPTVGGGGGDGELVCLSDDD